MAREIRVFGPLSYRDGELRHGPRDVGGIKAKQILEILIAARGRTVGKHRLAELLWTRRHMPRHPQAAVEHHVCLLRKAIGRHAVLTEPGGYRLGRKDLTLDIDRFDALVAEAARSPRVQARRCLRDALAYAARGDILEDEPDAGWADAVRADYLPRLLTALADAAGAALADGDFRDALGYGDRAIALDPFLEAGHRLKMLSLYGLGRHHDAAAAFHRLAGMLDAELGARPAPATRSLYTEMLRQAPIQQLLPRQTTPAYFAGAGTGVPLLGRERELSAVDNAIRAAHARGSYTLVLVVGEPGTGKTRLLEELAIRHPGRLGMGACSPLHTHLAYVPLAAALRRAMGGTALPVAALPALRAAFPEAALTSGGVLPAALLPGGVPAAALSATGVPATGVPATGVPAAGLPAAGLPAAVDPLLVAEAVADLLSRVGPCVLVLDDLHEADRETLGVLSYLEARAVAVPAAVIATAARPITGLRHHHLVELGPLEPADLADLGVPNLYEWTGGHADLVAAALASGTVSGLADAMARIGVPALPLLRAAAVLEGAFEAEALARIASLDPLVVTGELESLCRRGLLVAEGELYRFRYEPFRHALVAGMSPAWRRVLSERARPPAVVPLRRSSYRRGAQSFSKGPRQDAV